MVENLNRAEVLSKDLCFHKSSLRLARQYSSASQAKNCDRKGLLWEAVPFAPYRTLLQAPTKNA